MSQRHSAIHTSEMARRKTERASRAPKREQRMYKGQVTMHDGIRIKRNGLPRSRPYVHNYALPTNARGELHR
jgi:hypothetical protein